MIKLILAIVAIILAVQWNNCRKVPGETVSTKSGTVEGITSISRDGREFYEWRGIPFAKPPVGALRFASPQPVEAWTGIRDASEYGATCAQVDMIGRSTAGEEDCLFLNVHTPKARFQAAKETGDLLPVMVWIHGGYFHFGSGDMTRANYFMDEDVVLVTINYRLGIFGFLSTQDENARGNMGLKDQALALKWVKENIATFGGNPEQITIFGESAGGASVHYQMISPVNKGLFARAISQSGSAFAPWALHADPVGQAEIFAKNIGCTFSSNKDLVDCLRRVDAKVLVQGQLPILSPEKKKHDTFVPVIEKIKDKEAFLALHPNEIYMQGLAPNIPWLTGLMADEGGFLVIDLTRNRTYRERVQQNWDIVDESVLQLSQKEKKFSKEIRNFYVGHDKELDLADESTHKKLIDMTSDRYFCISGQKAIGIHAKTAPVYPYWYTKKGPGLADILLALKGDYHPVIELLIHKVKTVWDFYVLGKEQIDLGVGHGDELAMQFHVPMLFDVPVTSPYYDFSKAFVKSWVSFAKGEHPEFKGVKFPKVTKPEEIKYLQISDNPKFIEYPHMERYNFWKKLNVHYTS